MCTLSWKKRHPMSGSQKFPAETGMLLLVWTFFKHLKKKKLDNSDHILDRLDI